MLPQLCFFVSIAFGFIAWWIVAKRYIWPKLRLLRRVEALRPLLVLHSFRFIGLAFLVPGVVSPELPSAFAYAAAYGDIIAATLALLALIALPRGAGIVIAWIFNLWGSADQCYRAHGGPVGRNLLYSDPHCAVTADHAWAGVPDSSATSK
jgi:hypothetical protein